MSRCEANVRPFPNDTELRCEGDADHGATHHSVLRDYAYPGSATTVEWLEDDRRTFYGAWGPCTDPGCILPAGHPRGHAT